LLLKFDDQRGRSAFGDLGGNQVFVQGIVMNNVGTKVLGLLGIAAVRKGKQSQHNKE